MDIEEKQAEALLKEFKGEKYVFGNNVLKRVGSYAAKIGDDVVIITGSTAKKISILDTVKNSIKNQGLNINDVLDGGRANAPKEDVYRLAYQLSRSRWDCVVAIGGGSCIDASKAALTLAMYGGIIEDYFGTGKVLEKSGGRQLPLIAIQTASSSSSHLTKYSNVTDMINYQKKLIVDESIVPQASIFQYDITRTMPPDLTKDGALDGISHCWEVWMGCTGKDYYDQMSEIAFLGIKLILENLPKALKNADDLTARYCLGLGTDLGGYSIMMGGTNAAHLGSFSLVDILSHGRACGILNPYYAILFSPAIQNQLKRVAVLYREAELIIKRIDNLKGRELAETVAKAMIKFSENIGFPTTLKEAGATEKHINKMLKAAKDPQLKMKLRNMPIPLNIEKGDIEKLMKPTLFAAYTGNTNMIPDVKT